VGNLAEALKKIREQQRQLKQLQSAIAELKRLVGSAHTAPKASAG
jgi:hypothetical protein